MKTLSLFVLLSLSSWVMASDATVEQYVATRLNVLQAQVDQLHDAISLLNNETLSDQEAFEQIGQPSFKAVDEQLKEMDFTPSSFYQFAYKNKTTIEQWLVDNSIKALEIRTLLTEFDQLIQTYDQLNKHTVSADEGSQKP